VDDGVAGGLGGLIGHFAAIRIGAFVVSKISELADRGDCGPARHCVRARVPASAEHSRVYGDARPGGHYLARIFFVNGACYFSMAA
jgi:hypothetical protein